MKQVLTSNHLPGVLEQLDKELQMAIDYIRTLMAKVDVRSSSNMSQTKSKSNSRKSSKEISTLSSENKNSSLRGNFVDECSQKQSKETNRISVKFSDEFYDEPNYYYGGKLFSKGLFISRPLVKSYEESNLKTDNLIFDSLDKMDLFKNKVDSPSKVESTPKNMDRMITLFDGKCSIQTPHVKKLDVSTLDKRKKKMNSLLKHVNVSQTNAVPTETSFSSTDRKVKDTFKLDLKSTLQTQTYECARCDAANNTNLDEKYTSTQTQTQPICLDCSSQTTKPLHNSSLSNAGVNTNLKQKCIINSSLPTQTYNVFPLNDSENNTALLQRLDTGLQTSFVILSKSEKLSSKCHKEKHRKITLPNAKKNGKVRLYEVINDTSLDEYDQNHSDEYNPLRGKTSPRKVKFLHQTALYKQCHNKLHERPVRDKNHINARPHSLDKIIPKRKYLGKSSINRKSYDCDFFRDGSMRNVYYAKNLPDHLNAKRKCKLKTANECVNIEGVSIDAWAKVSLLNILNSL